MVGKVAIMLDMWLSKWVLWLIGGCQSGQCGWHVTVKVGILAERWLSKKALWLSKWALWLVCG